MKITKNHKLGKRYVKTIYQEIKRLKTQPFHFQIKYSSVHCLTTPNFPCLIHYRIDKINNLVKIEAVIGTKISPSKWVK